MSRLITLVLVASFVGLGFADHDEKFKIDATEAKLLELTNAERKKENLPPLLPNALLFKAAREHSANMAKQGKLDHVLDDKTPADRIKATGYLIRTAGENIAGGSGLVPMTEIMKGWMESEGHRTNILRKEYLEIGLGIARNDKGNVYYTQVFGTSLK